MRIIRPSYHTKVAKVQGRLGVTPSQRSQQLMEMKWANLVKRTKEEPKKS